MKKVTLWPDLYREQGHWLPCINLAKTLQTAGYSIEFMGIPDTESIVTPYGAGIFRTVLSDVYPPGYSVENKLEPIDQRWKPHHLLPITRGALDSVFRPTGTGAVAPSLLVSGFFTALETLLIHYKYNIPFVTITTYLRHPQDTPAMHAKTKLLYMSQPLVRKLIDSAPASAGMSIDDFIKPFKTQPEIIPCPRDFDFTDPDWVHNANVSYVEPMILRTALVAGTPAPPDPTGIPANTKLIYGTSGSQVQDYEFRAREFFKNLIAMMSTQGMDQYKLVLAVGDKLLPRLNFEYGVGTDSNSLPSNVQLFDWVSQLDILDQADAVFMHGGLATIKESIWEKVPIVIVPHGKDQLDNALRIRRTGVGVVSDVSELDPMALRGLLTTATSSTWIRQNIAKMQAIFQAKDGAAATSKDSFLRISGVVSPT